MVKSITYTAIALLLLTSCTLSETFAPRNFEARVVVNGYLMEDGVHLTVNRNNPLNTTINEFPFQPIDNATISIFEGASRTRIATLTEGNNGVYSQSVNVTADESLVVRVDGPDQEPIESLPTRIPAPARSISSTPLEARYFENRSSGKKRVEIDGSFTLVPSPEGEVTYFIEVIGITSEAIIPLREQDDLDVEFAISCGIIGGVGIIFKATCFPGDDISLPFIASGDVEQELDSLKMIVHTLPGEFHEYALVETQGSDAFESLFTQPDLSISNFVGGLGYVTGRSSISTTVVLR